MEIEPIELARLPTELTPPLPEYQAGAQTAAPVFWAVSNVSRIRSSISSLSPNATAHTVSRSGVVIHGRRRLRLLDGLVDACAPA